MRILLDISHPAHVHFYRFFISVMKERGHEILVTAKPSDITLELLRKHNISFKPVGKKRGNGSKLLYEWAKRDFQLAFLARKFKPHATTGIHNPCMAHCAFLNRAKSIIFTDTEHAKLANSLTMPFSTKVFTPLNFQKRFGRKHTLYNSYHELAYLHPKRFKADRAVLAEAGLAEGEQFSIIRFVAWGAHHDIGHFGFDDNSKLKLIAELEKFGRVFISSEEELPKSLKKYELPISPHKLHHLLSFASLYVGEGATMAAEAALLGTPSIYVSTLWELMGNFKELEYKYGLLYNTANPAYAVCKAKEILSETASKNVWREKQKVLLNEKEDMLDIMLNAFESIGGGS